MKERMNDSVVVDDDVALSVTLWWMCSVEHGVLTKEQSVRL